jgi:hypothetical protein
VAKADAFYLLDDNPDDFALIVDYIYSGTVINVLPEQIDVLKVERCLRFIRFTGKLEFGEAASIIYPALRAILERQATKKDPTALITPEFIRIIPAKNNILELLSQAAMPEMMKRAGGKYEKELEEVEGFLKESWRQFQAYRDELQLSFPLNPDAIKKIL